MKLLVIQLKVISMYSQLNPLDISTGSVNNFSKLWLLFVHRKYNCNTMRNES
jgi:hypothetical protein